MTINKELEHVAQNYLDPLEKSIQEMKKKLETQEEELHNEMEMLG